MNFDPTTQKLVRSWMKAHVHFVREVIRRLQTVSNQPIGQPFDGDENEYLITREGIGYKVEHELDMNDGMLKLHAIPGRFVPSNHGPRWVNGKHNLHGEIERHCDQQKGDTIGGLLIQ